jgi:DNA-binding SARP family transcriptional activator/tetratricopeptide (TPR) repeat protein
MEFRILGPLDIRDGDRTIPVGGGRQRKLLALLILNANEAVSTDRIVEELWGERAPPTAPKVVQNHVSQLRRVLANGVLVTEGSGYTLRLEPGSLDLDRFERLLREGRGTLARDDAHAASAILREALALWRGPPLADFAYDSFAQAEIARLEERRLVTLEERIEADLALGLHADLVAELEALIARHPLRERLRGQLMVALYRSGRQGEALQVYHEARRALVEELGIEPGPALQQLERAVLRQDAGLELSPTVEAADEATDRRHLSGRLIGRERELESLLGALEDTLSGRGRVLLIGGEPGIGKSRLADELAERARQRGVVVLFGRAWEAGGAPAYWPWVQAIRAYIRDRDGVAVRRQLGSGAADVAQMLPALRELFPDIGAPASSDPEGARFRLFDATAFFFRRAAAVQPLVLVLDDLHVADTPSLLLLEFLARELVDMRLLVVGAYRDTELEPESTLSATVAELARRPAATIRLTGFAPSDVSRFIEANHGIGSSRRLAEAIHLETEGNPLFVGEILRLLAAEGRLDEALEASTTRLGIPASVREVIGRRLRHLSDDCKRVLTLASVLGREFDLDALVRVTEYELDPLLDLLEEALSARVVGEVPGAHGRLRFMHILIRDTFYDDLPATRRLRLHRQIGEALEGLYATDLDAHLTELAYHFDAAGPAVDAAKAVQYARRAGDRASALLAYEEAARLYATGIKTLEAYAGGDKVGRCELLLRLGDVQARAGDIPSAKATFLRAAEIAREAETAEQLARAALGYGGRFIWSRGWGDTKLVPFLEEALAALPEEDSELRVRLLTRLAAGPLRDTLPSAPREQMSKAAVDMARRLRSPITLAYALEGRYHANWGTDVLENRLSIANELLQVASAAGDTERVYSAYDVRFCALLEAGDLPAAHRDHEAGSRLAYQLRQPAQLWESAVRRAQLALFEGRFRDADDAMHEALELGAPLQNANAELAFELQTYALRREQGRLNEVADAVQQAVDAYPAYPVWRYVLLDVLTELERTENARAALAACAADHFSLDLETQWLFALSLLPEVCRYLEDVDAAAAVYELLRPYPRRNAVLFAELSRGSVSRGLGILAATVADWNAAAGHFETALEMNAAMGARPWLAYTQYDYARMLLARGLGDRDRARDLLRTADALSRELGMTGLAEKVAVQAL